MTSLLAFVTVYLLGLASPGPDFVLTVRNSLLYTRATGVWTAAGLALAVGVHMLGCVFGISVLAARFPLFLCGLQLGGAAYLAALGVRLLHCSKQQEPQAALSPQRGAVHPVATKGSGGIEMPTEAMDVGSKSPLSERLATQGCSPPQAVGMGVLCNLLNPKAAVFFWALWAEIVHAAVPFGQQIACAFFAVTSTFAWFALVAIVLSARAVRQRFMAQQHWIARISGVALLCFALLCFALLCFAVGMGFLGSSSLE